VMLGQLVTSKECCFYSASLSPETLLVLETLRYVTMFLVF
jgi:hypothetical protein